MQNTIEIRPRRSGKTTELIGLFAGEFNDSYLIVPNIHMLERIKKEMVPDICGVKFSWSLLDKRMFTFNDFFNNFFNTESRNVVKNITSGKLKNGAHIYIDEVFLLEQNHIKILLENARNYKIYGIGTSLKLYDRILINQVRCMKQNHSINKGLDYFREDIQKAIKDDYLYNFLTEPNFKIISSGDQLCTYSREKLMTELLGQYCE
jgi:hypothetical protein